MTESKDKKEGPSSGGIDPHFYKPIAMWGWGVAASLFLLTIFLFIFAQDASSAEKKLRKQVEQYVEEVQNLNRKVEFLEKREKESASAASEAESKGTSPTPEAGE